MDWVGWGSEGWVGTDLFVTGLDFSYPVATRIIGPSPIIELPG